MTRRILITGAHGFLGSHLVAKLNQDRANVLFMPSMNECDLTDAKQVANTFSFCKPNVVFHLAAKVGGIGANIDNPGPFWRDNLLMGINVLDACRDVGVERLVLVGTTCSYPKVPKTIPFVESELWDGYPEETNAPYGLAKSALIVGADAYRKQYGLDTVTLIPTNMYGPRDNFDPRTSHVIPAIMRKIHEAKTQGIGKVVVWGTGKATRDFVYAPDVVDALISAASVLIESEDFPRIKDPINIGSGLEVSISEVVAVISDIIGYEGHFVWDKDKPDGQPRRCLNVTKALKYLGWGPKTSFVRGLEETYEWYRTVAK